MLLEASASYSENSACMQKLTQKYRWAIPRHIYTPLVCSMSYIVRESQRDYTILVFFIHQFSDCMYH